MIVNYIFFYYKKSQKCILFYLSEFAAFWNALHWYVVFSLIVSNLGDLIRRKGIASTAVIRKVANSIGIFKRTEQFKHAHYMNGSIFYLLIKSLLF